MDRQVKYMNAIRRVKMAGQSQRELLKLLQAKLQERVNSYVRARTTTTADALHYRHPLYHPACLVPPLSK